MYREIVGKMELHLSHDVDYRNNRRAWRGEPFPLRERASMKSENRAAERSEYKHGAVQ